MSDLVSRHESFQLGLSADVDGDAEVGQSIKARFKEQGALHEERPFGGEFLQRFHRHGGGTFGGVGEESLAQVFCMFLRRFSVVEVALLEQDFFFVAAFSECFSHTWMHDGVDLFGAFAAATDPGCEHGFDELSVGVVETVADQCRQFAAHAFVFADDSFRFAVTVKDLLSCGNELSADEAFSAGDASGDGDGEHGRVAGQLVRGDILFHLRCHSLGCLR